MATHRGIRTKLDEAQRRALAEIGDSSPDPDRDHVVRQRRKDVAALIYTCFRVSLDKITIRRDLRKFGFRKFSVRPRHYT